MCPVRSVTYVSGRSQEQAIDEIKKKYAEYFGL